MRVATLRRSKSAAAPDEIVGRARLDKRTKTLTKRLEPGDIAVIDHTDIDRVSAEALVRSQVRAVVNASPSISGLYPNLGPDIIVAAGIPLLDDVGADIFAALKEGTRVKLDGDELVNEADGSRIAKGTILDAAAIAVAMEEAHSGLAQQLEAFASNTMEYLRNEGESLLESIKLPPMRTVLADRHVLMVVRGYGYREDLASLRPYIREYRPLLLGVDGGADALREEGYVPDLIVGDMDSISDEVLKCGAEVIVHAYPDGRAPGLERVEKLGVKAVVFPTAGTSEDAAMLLADEGGATLIVAVGTHATLVEFLDKGRAGMSSTFLTRLRVGGKLVDAKGVSRLYRSRIRAGSLVLLVLAALLTLVVAVLASETGRTFLDIIVDKWHGFTFWFSKLIH